MRCAPGRGFTLIELMIAVAIVALLAALAYPSYVRYIVRANRSAAQSFMYTLSTKQEQYLLDARSYAADFATLNTAVPPEVARSYSFAVTSNMAATPPTYLITATPIGAQLTNDTRCGALTLDNLGTKTQSGTATSLLDCW